MNKEYKALGYYQKWGGGTIEDVEYTTVKIRSDREVSNWDIEDLCKYIWDYNDGWEWLNTGEEITVVIGGKEIGDYKIMVDFEPQFYTEKIKGVK